MLTLKAVVAVCTVVGLALGNPSDLSCEDPRLSDGEKIMHLTVRNPNQARIHEATCVFSCSCFFFYLSSVLYLIVLLTQPLLFNRFESARRLLSQGVSAVDHSTAATLGYRMLWWHFVSRFKHVGYIVMPFHHYSYLNSYFLPLSGHLKVVTNNAATEIDFT